MTHIFHKHEHLWAEQKWVLKVLTSVVVADYGAWFGSLPFGVISTNTDSLLVLATSLRIDVIIMIWSHFCSKLIF